MGDDTPSKIRTECVDDGKFAKGFLAHGRRIMPIGMGRCQEGNKRGARHLHTRNLAGQTADEKPRACIVRFVHATFFTAETSTPP